MVVSASGLFLDDDEGMMFRRVWALLVSASPNGQVQMNEVLTESWNSRRKVAAGGGSQNRSLRMCFYFLLLFLFLSNSDFTTQISRMDPSDPPNSITTP